MSINHWVFSLHIRCGHCKKLAPELETAAKVLKNNDPPVAIAKVDATEEKDLGTRFDVSGYPTLKIFRKGKEFQYNGPRQSSGKQLFHLAVNIYRA